jgi:Protein of unknown function (DUF1493)
MNDSQKKQAYQFIESKIGLKINENTIFFDDLGITGDDAKSLMEDIGEHFNIDLRSYDPNKYHEYENNIFNIFRTIQIAIFSSQKFKINSFKITHLFKVIEKGEWFDSVT